MNMTLTAPTISPRAGLLLTQLTNTADFDAALWKLLFDYLDLKLQTLAAEDAAFVQKWGMSFAEFQRRVDADALEQDVYSYAVEQDFWEWEKIETLRQYYEGLRERWK
ncbi:MAG TPA: hypothetical protein DCL15_17055 [Chloroflexi bacterium]|nr:hypothetical protein [Chloroflexota bacterium]